MNRSSLMSAALLALIASASAAEWKPELLASVASYHWVRNDQNEVNPGAGLGLGVQCGDWQPYGAAVAYRDSHEDQAQVAVVGMRYDLATWIGVDVGAGYLKSSTYNGPAVIPSVYVGRDPIRFQISALGTRALGLTIRFNLN